MQDAALNERVRHRHRHGARRDAFLLAPRRVRRRILVDSEITPIRDILSFFHLFSFGVWQTIVPAAIPTACPPCPWRHLSSGFLLSVVQFFFTEHIMRIVIALSSFSGMLFLVK